MKKYLLILLITSPLYAAPTYGEVYTCSYDFFDTGKLNFTFKRVIHSKTLVQFQYQQKNETPLLHSITNETDNYIYLMRDIGGSSSNHIIGKKDNTYVGAYLKHNESSPVFNGECFLVK
jgi:hypothetical protein